MTDRERAVSEENPIKVFVTHAFEESDDYLRVFEFLESVDRFYYLNVAKPENMPSEGGLEAIKDELIQQIKAAEAFVVVQDVYARKADLVNYMMDVAEANGIGMVAIKPFGGVE
jgi:aryl-alcohol dehydrogenase-like predicted oxidoreductase